MAPTMDDDGGEAADEPPNDAPSRTGLDFLRGLHQNPPLVSTAGPSSCRGEKFPPSRPAGSSAVELDSAPATVILTEVDEYSSAASKKKRRFAQAYLPFGTPPAKTTPPPAPVEAPSLVSHELTRAEKAEEKFLKAQQLYVTQWLPKFEWLLLDKTEEGLPILRCSICAEHGKDDAKFGRNGSGERDLQLGSMRCHELSVRHDDAMKRQRTLMAEIEKQKRIDDFANADKEGALISPTPTRRVRGSLASCGAWSSSATTTLQSPCSRSSWASWPKKVLQTSRCSLTGYGFNEMAGAMAKYQGSQQLQHLLASPFIGLTFDESTDRAHGKHLIVFATFLKNGVAVTEFLALLMVQKCDASSLFIVLMSHLDSVGVDINRVSGVGTDGASVMTGDKGGLVSCLCERVPHLVGCHCVAHREALKFKDAAKAFPDLNMIDEGVRAIGEIKCRSNIWYERFKELQQEIHKTNLEHQGLFNVRWLSRGDAIARLCRVEITQVAKEVDRTITIITHRYIEYGETFGGEVSNQLSRFIKDHSGENRALVVEGIDGDGRPTSHRFELSENPIKKHKFGGTFADCVKLCTVFAKEIVARMKFRMWDLQQMGGAKLFQVELWPSREDQRDIKCLDWLAQNDELLGGVLPATVVTDPSFESAAASALVDELVHFVAACRLDYASSLVAQSESDCPPSIEGECALVLFEDRQEDFESLAAAVPHLVAMLLAPEGDPDAPKIPTPRSYAKAITGPYSSQCQTAMDADMASWKSTSTYVDAVLLES
ncbi:unnamed protein product [Closterium sp. NIES-53]